VTLADVNVLLAVFRRDHEFHDICRRWLERTLDSGESFAVAPLILAAVMRISTTPNIYAQPSKMSEAFEFSEALLEHPAALIVGPSREHWRIFRELCRAAKISGRHVTDAWHAALAVEHDCEWVTLDRGFSRFPGLRWRTP
jgi:hypothetical protein